MFLGENSLLSLSITESGEVEREKKRSKSHCFLTIYLLFCTGSDWSGRREPMQAITGIYTLRLHAVFSLYENNICRRIFCINDLFTLMQSVSWKFVPIFLQRVCNRLCKYSQAAIGCAGSGYRIFGGIEVGLCELAHKLELCYSSSVLSRPLPWLRTR